MIFNGHDSNIDMTTKISLGLPPGHRRLSSLCNAVRAAGKGIILVSHTPAGWKSVLSPERQSSCSSLRICSVSSIHPQWKSKESWDTVPASNARAFTLYLRLRTDEEIFHCNHEVFRALVCGESTTAGLYVLSQAAVFMEYWISKEPLLETILLGFILTTRTLY